MNKKKTLKKRGFRLADIPRINIDETGLAEVGPKEHFDYSTSSGNVFADLGVSNPEERLAKVKLAYQINELIKHKKLTQKAAAELLKIDQPEITALKKGRLSGFSLERLFRFLNDLGQDVTIQPQAPASKLR